MKKFNLLSTPYFQLPSRGFSLIELLVVIAIIGILTTLTIANYVGVRERSRDAQRKANLNEMKAALEFYKIDNGSYPASITCGSALSAPSPSTTVYIQKVPCDPIYTGTQGFSYNSPGTTYTLRACMENINDSDPAIVTDTTCPKSKAYVVTNP